MKENNVRRGALLMCATSLIFAAQDGISRHLAETYNVFLVVMIRYWLFAAFAIYLASRGRGGLRGAVHSHFPVLQTLRGLLMVANIWIMVTAFTLLGLINSHSVMACYPLLVAALSVPLLGEKVGWRRWTAITVGLIGVLIILRPGVDVIEPKALIPLGAALLFALYSVLTRYVARADDSNVSYFWVGITGCIATTAVGIFHWEPMTGPDWAWMVLLCCTAALGHWLLIRALETAEVSAVQPFAYLQLVFVTLLGITVFGEVLRPNVAIGIIFVVGAGLFTLWRARQVAEQS